jgi:hypothetical protein
MNERLTKFCSPIGFRLMFRNSIPSIRVLRLGQPRSSLKVLADVILQGGLTVFDSLLVDGFWNR